ncbi:MAG: hypothetical protein OEY99_02280 [Aigarchaeota archaeon]|nr:hypothetical protein [Aigarchaeota archaeon]MDH5703017.1 hypothetical protein [Aigarchaeota archaeon]
MSQIVDLPDLVASLPAEKRALVTRIFRISAAEGFLVPPESMRNWIIEHFGSTALVKRQRIVKVTNLVTMEGTLFNELRASRPMQVGDKSYVELSQAITGSLGDPFCRPREMTPEDIFGRVRGKHCITASNIAKYDVFHGLVIFNEHDPLKFTEEEVEDYIDTALKWAAKVKKADHEAKYFFFMWNCLWKSGASIVHGHLQLTMSRDMHYGRVEHLRRAALGYERTYGSNYFDDLFDAHHCFGLAMINDETKVLAYLTPIKEKEVLLVADVLDRSFKKTVYKVIRCLVDTLGTASFNLAVYTPPMSSTNEDWTGFPVVARIVDRGDPSTRTADVGAMELYASSVVSSDPFKIAESLREYFAKSP